MADDPARHEIMCIQASCSLLLKCLPVENSETPLTMQIVSQALRVLYYHSNTIHSF